MEVLIANNRGKVSGFVSREILPHKEKLKQTSYQHFSASLGEESFLSFQIYHRTHTGQIMKTTSSLQL